MPDEQVVDTSTPSENPVVPETPETTEAPAPGTPETVEGAEATLKDPTATKTEKKEAKSTLEKFNLKVYGKEFEETIDLGNKNDLTKRFQKAAAADRSMAEAAEIKKAALQFIDELKKNPRKVFRDANLGIDERKLAEEIMNEALEDLEKSPEQREHAKLLKELEDIKQQRDSEKKDWESREFSRLQAEHERTLETDISAALDIGGLPKTPRTVKAMAELMMVALENNIELSAKDIAPIIKANTMSDFKEIISSLGDDQLDDFLGKDVLGRLRKKNIAKSKSVESANSVKATGNDVKKTEAPAEKKQTFREMFGV